MRLRKSIIIGLMICLSISVGTAGTLNSIKVAEAPVIDGEPEAIWDGASAMMVNVAGGSNAGSHTVILKSVYTDDSIYFLVTWNDPTESLRREPWVKQSNGTWKQIKDPDDKGGDNNMYYEDKFAQIWNINTSAFNNTGCFAVCHAGETGKPYGNKYTANMGEMADIWHAKLVRTNPAGFIDDQYLDSTRYNATTAAEAGRKSDPGLVPYYVNINNAKTAPNYTSADQPAPPYWIKDSEKQPFEDTYKADDEIAAIISRSPTEDRADIKGKAVYKDGNWMLEYGRKLDTGSMYDVQFSDLKKEYSFGNAVFDNAQVRHSFETGVSKLVFMEQAAPAVTTTAGMTTMPSTTEETPGFEILIAIAAFMVIIFVRRR